VSRGTLVCTDNYRPCVAHFRSVTFLDRQRVFCLISFWDGVWGFGTPAVSDVLSIFITKTNVYTNFHITQQHLRLVFNAFLDVKKLFSSNHFYASTKSEKIK